MKLDKELQSAWDLRKSLRFWDFIESTNAFRVYHGPGEGHGRGKWVSCDWYANQLWVTLRPQTVMLPHEWKDIQESILQFYPRQGVQSIVAQVRYSASIKGAEKLPKTEIWWGHPPQQPFLVKEEGNHYWIEFFEGQHPGLFLDHRLLRQWLQFQLKSKTVLNTFGYTGSLTIAAARGGADRVCQVDLSRRALNWAKKNWEVNFDTLDQVEWIQEDVFQYLAYLKRRKQTFEVVILDPPSFSHGKGRVFSTFQNLDHLLQLAREVTAPLGYLIVSINSSGLSLKNFQDQLTVVLGEKEPWLLLKTLQLPESYPTVLGDPSASYLKGFILKRMR